MDTLTDDAVGPRRRQGLAAQIVDDLRRRIFSGELKQGARIDQVAVARQHDASHIPVREALIALHQEGLVRTVPRRGTYVATFTPEDVRDQYEICGLVAGLAAARAAEHLDEAGLAALREAHEQFLETSDATARQESNAEFHRIVNSTAGGRLRATLRLINRTLPSHHYELTPRWTAAEGAYHARLVDAIAAHDADGARNAMLEHFVAGGEAAVTALEAAGFWEHDATEGETSADRASRSAPRQA